MFLRPVNTRLECAEEQSGSKGHGSVSNVSFVLKRDDIPLVTKGLVTTIQRPRDNRSTDSIINVMCNQTHFFCPRQPENGPSVGTPRELTHRVSEGQKSRSRQRRAGILFSSSEMFVFGLSGGDDVNI
ncbi:hypothetical protein F2P81_025612 [Scophthalmus maximus]|uniref:Uncharacterized protein n=1 Tax=Scophthalmus maximus TaxID=52904 RepID=A0A6A4RPN3_SCOMX|nr:hypothetical protein F2P81_025612 [Scophthalmus maximus]